MELKFEKGVNLRERLAFIHFYAEWVKRVPNEVWSEHQATLIDSYMENAQNVQTTPAKYVALINRAKSRKTNQERSLSVRTWQ
jgi:hypothetical protein